MSTLTIYRGVPGSGKTTDALKEVRDTPGTVRVSRDDIRFTNFGVYWGVDENLVTKLQYAAFKSAFEYGAPVISDATNLVAKDVRSQMELADKYGYDVEFRDFPVDVDEAIRRDAAREKQVGEKVIRSFHQRFIRKDGSLPPIPAIVKQDSLIFQPYVAPGPGFPHAILVDIDGTLAHMTNRGPYDTSKYADDDFDHTIANIVEQVANRHGQNCHIIVMSGRDAAFRDVTLQWMNDFDFGPDALIMRPEGDLRNDAIVKNELFEQHIAGKYNVDFVLDDRDRVVKMWRAKGLKCLQVADGDF